MNSIVNVQLSSFAYHMRDSKLAKGKQNTKHTDGWTLAFPFNLKVFFELLENSQNIQHNYLAPICYYFE